jgi:multimeric flavodoxin WrbA
MGNNILVLSASPRKNGNTERLAAAFIAGAKAAGKNVRLFRVADMDIAPCQGCNACFKHPGVCAQKDDMAEIVAAIGEANTIVFASPVYLFGVSAQLKIAIDRMHVFKKVGTPVKKAALLLTCGSPTKDVSEPSVAMFRMIVSYQKWREAGIVIAPNLHIPGEIEGRPELAAAQKLGEEI